MEFSALFDLHHTIARWRAVPKVQMRFKKFFDALKEYLEHAETTAQAFSGEKSVVAGKACLLQQN